MCPKVPEKRNKMSAIPYASAIGSIMYVMLFIGPDVAYALSVRSCFQLNLRMDYWIAMKTILKYLRCTKDLFLYTTEENWS